ncbi:MAG: hypothetical protein CAK89_03995 [Opitutia bacterium AMD-G3]|nr:MAG: hypothetical protein CAK89_03995 [Opitutae bacterium AMD-G3]
MPCAPRGRPSCCVRTSWAKSSKSATASPSWTVVALSWKDASTKSWPSATATSSPSKPFPRPPAPPPKRRSPPMVRRSPPSPTPAVRWKTSSGNWSPVAAMPDMNARLTRSSWIARITFLEAIRQRFFAFLLVLSAAMVVSSVSFRFMDFGHSELKFVADFAFGGMFLFGSVLALVMTAQLFFAEIDNRTALTLLAKPLSRTEFLLGKFLGTWAVLGVFVFSLAFLQGVILWSRTQELIVLAAETGRVAPDFSVSGLAAFAVLQWFRLGVVAAMVLMVSAVARTFLFAVIVGAMAIVAGQLQWLAQEALLKPSDANALTKGLLWLSSRVIPNLQQFNIGDTLVLDPTAISGDAVWSVVLSGFFYLVAFLALASLAFRRREI